MSYLIIITVANVYWTPTACQALFWVLYMNLFISSSFQPYELLLRSYCMDEAQKAETVCRKSQSQYVAELWFETLWARSLSSSYWATMPSTLPPPKLHASTTPCHLSSTSVWVLRLYGVFQAVSSEMTLSKALSFLCWNWDRLSYMRHQPLHIQSTLVKGRGSQPERFHRLIILVT